MRKLSDSHSSFLTGSLLIIGRLLIFTCVFMLLCVAAYADDGDEYRLIPAGHIGDKPFYIDYALFFQTHMPGFEDGKNFVKFDDKYGSEQEVIWIWFSGGAEEARLYTLDWAEDWESVTLGQELFSVALGSNDVLEFHTQIPESVPRTALWFVTPGGPKACMLGYNGRTGAVNPLPIEP